MHSRVVGVDTGEGTRAGPEGFVAVGWNLPNRRKGGQKSGCCIVGPGQAVVVEVCGDMS